MASSSGDLVEHATSVHASHSANCVVNKECKYNVGAGRSGVDKAHYHCDLCGKATDRPQRARDHYQKKHVKGKAAGTCHHHHVAVHARANASTVTGTRIPDAATAVHVRPGRCKCVHPGLLPVITRSLWFEFISVGRGRPCKRCARWGSGAVVQEAEGNHAGG